MIEQLCPIWKTPAQVNPAPGRDAYHISGERSGVDYLISRTALSDGLLDRLSLSQKCRVTAWLCDQTDAGDIFPILTTARLSELAALRPFTMAARMARFWRALYSFGYETGDRLFFLDVLTGDTAHFQSYMTARTGAASYKELAAIAQLLSMEGYLQRASQNSAGVYFVSAKGFEKLDQLATGGADTLQVFVAMWFNSETEAAYRDGITPAILDAGYQPFRIDGKEHNNKIDDEIVAGIRASRFLVADFTCGMIEGKDGKNHANARGGVYYEAGLAQGLGMPVVWCIRQDLIGETHFDTRQYNHITWSDPADLRTRLRARIAATIGVRTGAALA